MQMHLIAKVNHDCSGGDWTWRQKTCLPKKKILKSIACKSGTVNTSYATYLILLKISKSISLTIDANIYTYIVSCVTFHSLCGGITIEIHVWAPGSPRQLAVSFFRNIVIGNIATGETSPVITSLTIMTFIT